MPPLLSRPITLAPHYSRAPWLLRLIDLTKKPDHYITAIFSHDLVSVNSHDVAQLSELIMLLAQRGNPIARPLLYEKFDRLECEKTHLIGQYLLKLDGLAAMHHIAQTVGKKILSGGARQETNELISYYCETPDKKKQPRPCARQHPMTLRLQPILLRSWPTLAA